MRYGTLVLGLLCWLLPACGGGGGAAGEPVAEAAAFLFAARGPADDVISSIDVDAKGRVYLTGFINDGVEFGESTTLGAENGLLFAASLDSDGALLWVRTDGESGGVQGVKIGSFPDGSCLVAGEFRTVVTFDRGGANQASFTPAGGRDICLLRLAADGELIWARRVSATGLVDRVPPYDVDDRVNDLLVFEDGSFLLAASYTTNSIPGLQTRLVGPGWMGTYVAGYASDGTLQWLHTYDSPSPNHAIFAPRPDGSILFAANIFESESFGGTTLTRAADGTCFIAAFERDGTPLWIRGDGGSEINPLDLEVSADGSFTLVGEMFGDPVDVAGPSVVRSNRVEGRHSCIVRFDADGVPQWVRKDGGTIVQSSLHLFAAGEPDGTLTVLGSFEGATSLGDIKLGRDGPRGYYLTRIAPNGEIRWARLEGGEGFFAGSFGGGLRLTTDRRLILAGNHLEEAAVGEGTTTAEILVSRGRLDFFVAVLENDGTLDLDR